ncbi:MAG: hypothetical protein JXR70_09370 [Spirochaetales bacterium]|nr:hypothetical protein [Spirochaetales bacterium]
MSTTYKINFDFTSSEQRLILDYLQQNQYQLLGYKGAKGTGQITAGVPTWFSVPFGNIFGMVDIDYQPKYKVYIFNKAKIAANTTIEMQSLSVEYGLGTSVIFNQDGSFSTGSESVPADSIRLKNNRPADTPDLTVGLAGLVNLPSGNQYLPFCAFTLPPQNSLNMTPQETICLFAARTALQSGNVQGNAAAPGCEFSFSASTIEYFLQILASTYQVTNVPGTPGVKSVASGETLTKLLNS